MATALCATSALGLAACGGDDHKDEHITVLNRRTAALEQSNKDLQAENAKLKAQNAALTSKASASAKRNAILQLQGVGKAARVSQLKARNARAKKAATAAADTATALGKTAASLGSRNSALKRDVKKLQTQLDQYQAAAKVVEADYAAAADLQDVVLRCTDLVRKAFVGSRSPGAAQTVCRTAAQRIKAYDRATGG